MIKDRMTITEICWLIWWLEVYILTVRSSDKNIYLIIMRSSSGCTLSLQASSFMMKATYSKDWHLICPLIIRDSVWKILEINWAILIKFWRVRNSNTLMTNKAILKFYYNFKEKNCNLLKHFFSLGSFPSFLQDFLVRIRISL